MYNLELPVDSVSCKLVKTLDVRGISVGVDDFPVWISSVVGCGLKMVDIELLSIVVVAWAVEDFDIGVSKNICIYLKCSSSKWFGIISRYLQD